MAIHDPAAPPVWAPSVGFFPLERSAFELSRVTPITVIPHATKRSGVEMRDPAALYPERA